MTERERERERTSELKVEIWVKVDCIVSFYICTWITGIMPIVKSNQSEICFIIIKNLSQARWEHMQKYNHANFYFYDKWKESWSSWHSAMRTNWISFTLKNDKFSSDFAFAKEDGKYEMNFKLHHREEKNEIFSSLSSGISEISWKSHETRNENLFQ